MLESYTPFIFSHGNKSSKMAHSSTARELASNGAIVFLIDHHDGTNFYVEIEEGVGKAYDNSKSHYNRVWRTEC